MFYQTTRRRPIRYSYHAQYETTKPVVHYRHDVEMQRTLYFSHSPEIESEMRAQK